MKHRFRFALLMALAAIVLSVNPPDMLADPPTATQPFKVRTGARQLSPFTAVRWHGDAAQVKIENGWFELCSIDDVSVDAMIEYLVEHKDPTPRRHFAEDLVEVMTAMGHEPGTQVKLELRTLDKKREPLSFPAELTEDNCRSVAADFEANAKAREESAEFRRAKLDADHERLVDLMNKYTIDYRQAAQDITDIEAMLIQKGGASVGADGSPKEMEMKRLVQEQLELATQLLGLDTDADQFKESKSKGTTPAPIARTVDSNSDVVRAREILVADKIVQDKYLNAAARDDAVAAAQKTLDDIRAAVTTKAMADYDDDLTWRRQNIKRRLDRFDGIITQLKADLAEIASLKRRLAIRQADAETYRSLQKKYDEQIRDIEELEQTGLKD